MGFAGCSSDGNQFAPEDVLTNALKQHNEVPFSYYSEVELKNYENEALVDHYFLKEWVDKDGKRRMEAEASDGGEKSIAVYDGHTLISYEPEENRAFVVEGEESLALNQISPRQVAEQLLNMVKDTHEITLRGEETVAGRDTYRIQAEAKDQGALWGDQEVWIDKENWMVLKLVIHTGNTMIEMEYTKVELNSDISPDLFKLELPEDVQLMDLDELNQSEQVTLDEAAEQIGSPFLYFPETGGLTIEGIEMYRLEGEINRPEANLDYAQNGVPYLTLTVFPAPEDDGSTELFPGEEAIKVRNQEGTWMEMDHFRSLAWQEDGITYSILVHHPHLTKEELLSLTETMIPVK